MLHFYSIFTLIYSYWKNIDTTKTLWIKSVACTTNKNVQYQVPILVFENKSA